LENVSKLDKIQEESVDKTSTINVMKGFTGEATLGTH